MSAHTGDVGHERDAASDARPFSGQPYAGRAVSELRLTMKLSNNRLRRQREALGLSPKQASERAGVAYQAWLDLENLRAKPLGLSPGFGGRFGWRSTAVKIAASLGLTCEWLWPEEVLAVVDPVVVREIDAADLRPQLTGAQMLMLPAPSAETVAVDMETTDDAERLAAEMLELLSPREAKVVSMRLGLSSEPQSFEEIGEVFEVSRGRAGQIFEKAMGKMQRAAERKVVRRG